MKIHLISLAAIVVGCPAWAEPDVDRAKKSLKSDYFTVVWGTPTAIPANTELEIGDGGGHGDGLEWLRFRPGKDGVEVLELRLKEVKPASVVVRRAILKPDTYAGLLRDLGMVNASKLLQVKESRGVSSLDLWVNTRLVSGAKTLAELDWAGYWNFHDDAENAKPRVAVKLAREAVEGLDFKDHKLTDAQREWVSTKFAHDWKKFEGLEYHWWVRERYVRLVGLAGDRTALPLMHDILSKDPPKEYIKGPSDWRCATYAITAIGHITKTDLWGPGGEVGNLETARRKALDLLKERK